MKKPNGKDCLLIEGLCSCGACHDKTEVPADGGEAFRKWRGNVFTTDPPNTPPIVTEQRLELQAALGTGAWMLEAKHGTDIAKQNAALRACVTYARSKRGKDFDFDTWEAMCEAAMAGEHAPSALEGEIALHAQTRDALIAVRKERDALLVDTCRGASCGKCLCCRAKQPAHDDLEYAQDEAVFELDNTEP